MKSIEPTPIKPRFYAPGAVPGLPPGIDVWTGPATASVVEAEIHALTKDEQLRTETMRDEAARTRFICGRVLLRRLAAEYLHVAMSEILFAGNVREKPRLHAALLRKADLRFNLSHSGAHLLAAFGIGRELGVDIECVSPKRRWEAVATRFFAAEELEAICALRAQERMHAFYRVWVRKEAYVKARGRGLRIALDSFAVSVAESPPRLLRDDADVSAPGVWRIADIVAPDGYAAAVAAGPRENLAP